MTTTPMTYNELVTYLANLLQYDPSDTNFTTILPAAIQDAEQRIYLDMDFLNTRTVNSSANFTVNSRTFTLPTSPSTIMVLQGVAAITPAGQTPSQGTRNQLEPVSLDYIDSTWPQESMTGIPDSWAMRDDATIVVKPTPAAAYTVELTGTFRPNPMTVNNQNTYIGTTYPQLLLDACMVFFAGYQRDQALSTEWQGMYASQLKIALDEEQRRKGQGVAWTPFSATPDAAPPRT